MRPLRRLATLVAALALATAAPARAQVPEGPGQRRAALEERFRERIGALVQRRLALTDAQTAKLRASNQRFEQQRRELVREERETRQALRRQLAAGDAAADQQEVARLLDGMLAIHRRRLDIVAAEQRELATFLTPVQRAKYFALQDELRRRMQELQRQRLGDSGRAPARGRLRPRPPG